MTPHVLVLRANKSVGQPIDVAVYVESHVSDDQVVAALREALAALEARRG